MPKLSNCRQTHPSREGGPCTICGSHNKKYWHIANALPHHGLAVENLQQQFKVSETDCICWNCHRKWNTDARPVSKKRKMDSMSCLIPHCNHGGKIHQTDRGDESKIRYCFKIAVEDAQQIPQSDGNFYLCHVHYNEYSRYLSPPTNCSVCHCHLPNNRSSRPCQDAESLTCFLKDHSLYTEDAVDLTNLYLCLTCLTSYSRYCKGESFVREQRCSKSYLQELLNSLEQNVYQHNCIDFSIYKTLMHMGQVLLSDKAVLLDTLYQYFVQCCQSFDTSQCECHNLHPLTEKQVKTLLLRRIRASLGECVASYCNQGNERLGTVFRRFGTDVQKCLLKSLFECNKENDQLKRQIEESQRKLKELEFQAQSKSPLTVAADELQSRVAAQAKSFSESRPHIDTFDVMSVIKSVDPVVWNFLVRISLSKQEIKTLYSDMTFSWDNHYLNTHQSSTVKHNKQLKRLNIICCLLFLQNDQAYLPFHMLISDIVDKFTNSSAKCLAILSQFGICVSKDTFLRYQKQIAELEMINKPFSSDAFTIVSIDNIDKNSQYAAVRSSQLTRGFHGTSIQAAQPLPKSTKSQAATVSFSFQGQAEQTETRRDRRISLSTVTSYHSGSNQMFNPVNPQRNRRFHLTIEDFQLSDEESASLKFHENFLFQYVLTKTSTHITTPDLSLPGIKAAHLGNSLPNTEQSDIQFVAVLPEPADSTETIKHSLSLLYSFGSVPPNS